MNVGEKARLWEKKTLSERMEVGKETLTKVLASFGLYLAIMLIMEIFI